MNMQYFTWMLDDISPLDWHHLPASDFLQIGCIILIRSDDDIRPNRSILSDIGILDINGNSINFLIFLKFLKFFLVFLL